MQSCCFMFRTSPGQMNKPERLGWLAAASPLWSPSPSFPINPHCPRNPPASPPTPDYWDAYDESEYMFPSLQSWQWASRDGHRHYKETFLFGGKLCDPVHVLLGLISFYERSWSQSLWGSPDLIFPSLTVSSRQLISQEKSNGTDKVQNDPPPPSQTSTCATARLWLCRSPCSVMSLPPLPSPSSLSVFLLRPGTVQQVLSSFWKKRKVSCPGLKGGELAWRTDRRGPATGRRGPSATRPGACPSAAGQSLGAYRPGDKDGDVRERRTAEKCHTERTCGGGVTERVEDTG